MEFLERPNHLQYTVNTLWLNPNASGLGVKASISSCYQLPSVRANVPIGKSTQMLKHPTSWLHYLHLDRDSTVNFKFHSLPVCVIFQMVIKPLVFCRPMDLEGRGGCRGTQALVCSVVITLTLGSSGQANFSNQFIFERGMHMVSSDSLP